jgi:hypothetical protein
MTAPICGKVCKRFESVWNAMIDLFLVLLFSIDQYRHFQQKRVTYSRVGLGNAFSDDIDMTFLVTCVSAILALITRSIEQEIPTEGTKHELIETLLDKLVAVHLVNFVLTLANSTLTAKTTKWGIQWTFAHILLD